jgi:AAA domain (Cdc48 subfamily)
MNKFSSASDSEFEDLRARCQNQCAVYPARRLPPGCSPDTARIGVESRQDGAVSLMVERGISYNGRNTRLKSLFQDGQLEFTDFEELKVFLRNVVRRAFFADTIPESFPNRPFDEVIPAATSPSSAGRPMSHIETGPLTDFGQITEQLERPKPQVHIDAGVLAKALKQRVIGQDEALGVLAGMAARQVNRSQPRRPTSVFMLGTTGVGKTKAAIALADCLSEQGASYTFLRLDMSEYQEKHRVSQLLGAPQGYIGHDEGAQLTKQLAKNSKMVVLLDEIEKAHTDIFTAFMNVFDSGRLSTPKAIDGKYEIDCKDTIFVLTSNLAVDELIATVDKASSAQNIDVMCRKHLTQHKILPELVGRIGAFCLFKTLTPAQRARIIVMAVSMVALEYGVEVEYVAPEVVVRLLNESDGRFGARPDEQMVDRIFGDTFAQARSRGVRSVRLMEFPSLETLS